MTQITIDIDIDIQYYTNTIQIQSHNDSVTTDSDSDPIPAARMEAASTWNTGKHGPVIVAARSCVPITMYLSDVTARWTAMTPAMR